MILEWLFQILERWFPSLRETREAYEEARLRTVELWIFLNDGGHHIEIVKPYEPPDDGPMMGDFLSAETMARRRAQEIARNGLWIASELIPPSRIQKIEVI